MGHYKEIDLTHVKKVLICMFKYHGDVILTSPVYTALRRALPHAQIDVYLFKDTLPMLQGHPAVSNFITFDQAWRKLSLPKRLWKEFSMWRSLRKNRYDLMINLTSGDRGAFVARVCGAPIRVGIEAGGGMPGKDRYFTQVVRVTEKPRHIVERNLDLMRAIGIDPEESEKDLVFAIPEEAREKIKRLVPFDDFIVIHPASRCDFKHWPIEKFSQLLKKLIERGEKVVISGGPGREEKEYIEKMMIDHPNVLSLAGKISLKELGALIDASKLLISVDSVPPHIAAALKKPTVVLFGPSDDIKWGPWKNPFAKVVRLNLPCQRCDQEGCGGTWMSDCLLKLPLERVLRAVDESLDSGKLRVASDAL